MKLSHSWKSIAAGLALASAAHVAQAGVPVGSRSAAEIATENARIAAILAEEQRTDTIKKMVIVGGVGGAIGFLGLKLLGLTPIKRRRDGERVKEKEQEIRKWIDSIPEMKRIFVEVERIVGERFPGTKTSLRHVIGENSNEWLEYSFGFNKHIITLYLGPSGNLYLHGFDHDNGVFKNDGESLIDTAILEQVFRAMLTNSPLPKKPQARTSMNPEESNIQLDLNDEVDPISFANTCLDYRRYVQAESILVTAFQSEVYPSRKITMSEMLCKIYFGRNDTSNFLKYANILIHTDDHTPEMAERVRSIYNMGKRIDPENPLYIVPDWAQEQGKQDMFSSGTPDGEDDGFTSVGGGVAEVRRTEWSFPDYSSPWTHNGGGDLSLDIDFMPTDTRHQAAGMDEASRVGLDYGTLMRKIELAEEFLRIGDTEGAKDLIEEVIKEGRFSVPRGSSALDSINLIKAMIPDDYKDTGEAGDMLEFSPPSSEVEEDIENMSDEELIRKLESCKEISRILAGNIVSEIGTVMGKRGYNLDFTNKDPSSIACINALIDMLSGKNSPGESAQGGEGEGEGNSDDLSQQGSDLEGENYPAESSQNAFLSKFDEIIEKYQRELERLGRNKRTVINQINSGIYEMSEELDDGVTREKKGYEEKISRIQKLKESFMAFLEKEDGKISDTPYDIRIEGKVIFTIIKLSADEVRVFRHLPDGTTKSRTLWGNWLIQIWTSGILDLENI